MYGLGAQGGTRRSLCTCCSSGCGSLRGAGFTRLATPASVGLLMFSALRSSSNCSCSSTDMVSTTWHTQG